MLGTTNIRKISDKAKWVYSGYGIALDGTGSWSLGSDLARNVVIFGVDNSSSAHTDNCRNKFLILGERPTYDINGRFVSHDKSFALILVKKIQNSA